MGFRPFEFLLPDMYEIPIARRIFFWSLVAIFWLVSATIIGYTFGYRFSLERGVFVYAGSITLKTTPQEVDIFLDGQPIPSPSFSRLNNAFHIGGIKPGEYLLEVKSQKYQTWSKKITVHSGISTEFWNVILAENSYEQKEFDSSNVGKFFISPHKNLAALSEQNDGKFSVKILDPEASEADEVFSSDEYTFTNDGKENIEWSPQAHSIIIPAQKADEKNYFIVNIRTGQITDLRTITESENLSNVRWDPKNKDVLLYMSGSDLHRLDLDSPRDKKSIAQNIASYEVSSKGLFYFQLPQGIVYKIDFDATETPLQITTTSPDDMNDNSYKIIVYDIDRIVFLNKSLDLYVYNKGEEDTYFRKLSDNAEGCQFSDDGKKLLFWNNNEIFTYFARKWEEQPLRSENEVTPITHLSDPIKNVQWTRDYEHVLFTSNKKIKIIEIDNRDHRNMADVVSLGDNDAFVINNFTDGRIYFTEKNSEGKSTLHAIYFPEKTSLLQVLMPGTADEETTETGSPLEQQ